MVMEKFLHTWGFKRENFSSTGNGDGYGYEEAFPIPVRSFPAGPIKLTFDDVFV
jgi:hypothetical protein